MLLVLSTPITQIYVRFDSVLHNITDTVVHEYINILLWMCGVDPHWCDDVVIAELYAVVCV